MRLQSPEREIASCASRRVRLPEIARRFNMSPSTLERRLASEGLTFAQILEELKLGLAVVYLQEADLPISEIAWSSRVPRGQRLHAPIQTLDRQDAKGNARAEKGGTRWQTRAHTHPAISDVIEPTSRLHDIHKVRLAAIAPTCFDASRSPNDRDPHGAFA